MHRGVAGQNDGETEDVYGCTDVEGTVGRDDIELFEKNLQFGSFLERAKHSLVSGDKAQGAKCPPGCAHSRETGRRECAIGWGFQTWTFHPLICCAGIDPLASPTDDCPPGEYWDDESGSSGDCEGEMIGIVD